LAARTSTRRILAAKVSNIHKKDPADPRLPELRRTLDALHVAEIAEWAQQAARRLPALSHDEITKVSREVQAISDRLRQAS
jgi:hypothetical protein